MTREKLEVTVEGPMRYYYYIRRFGPPHIFTSSVRPRMAASSSHPGLFDIVRARYDATCVLRSSLNAESVTESASRTLQRRAALGASV